MTILLNLKKNYTIIILYNIISINEIKFNLKIVFVMKLISNN